MGAYADRIEAQHKAQHLSPEDIRAAKCQRSKVRNTERKELKRKEAEERNSLTLDMNRRSFRRKNNLKEFAV